MKIVSIEISNFKRLVAVFLKITPNGLTIIGGLNRQGKTSALDAIREALGGMKYSPTDRQRDGAEDDPFTEVIMDTGLVVRRKGKNGALEVTNQEGFVAQQPQGLLDRFVSGLSLDLSAFLNARPAEKADMVLEAIGVDLTEADELVAATFERRRMANRELDVATKVAEAAPRFFDEDGTFPTLPTDIGDLVKRLKVAIQKNETRKEAVLAREQAGRRLDELHRRLVDLMEQVEAERTMCDDVQNDVAQLPKPSKAVPIKPLEEQIGKATERNEQVAVNARGEELDLAVEKAKKKAKSADTKLKKARNARTALLDDATLPLPELSVDDDGLLRFDGRTDDGTSGSEQMKMATAIARATKPDCQFVLVDDIEQMDLATLEGFGRWAESEDLQVICTRVSDGEECSIVLHDGAVVVD